MGARLGCGAIAGTFGQTVAYPFDVARRRLQVTQLQMICLLGPPLLACCSMAVCIAVQKVHTCWLVVQSCISVVNVAS